ncbi:hypothetical protein HJC23_004342 [Cyclotella cryptica]|uniref:2Fe-2S ferredoxin-type domain-containing protein n=1 Tax=Cyclotella cryptica TaxID=29204 RepID=A0ABD3P1M7_9STRA|eukprot:CCRYP_019075-RA/>CCRYP_019075-RA protein AED:0.21 eAED:0.21 QI:289/1/1/1/0/0.33/3/2235/133
MSPLSNIIVIVFCALASSLVSGFTVGIPHSNTRVLSTQIHIFGNAFANDDSLGKAENPGLKKGPKVSEVTINGKPVKAVAGQKVSQVLAAARVKVTYSCRKGDCGTCEFFMNGRVEKACTAKIPQGKCVIQTN